MQNMELFSHNVVEILCFIVCSVDKRVMFSDYVTLARFLKDWDEMFDVIQ